ncbi:MAG: hypothetical protein GX824_02680 [Clostridiales bacterium]|nr:hypothetical protein [Clostridiales bacterium]
MQKRYWNNLTQYKFALFYLDAHFSRCVNIERFIKILLSLCSSASVASWAIWKEIGFVWAIIIAASQVISVINEFLPYKKRISEIAELKSRLTPIYFEAEKDWLPISSGELSEEEVNERYYKYMKAWTDTYYKFFVDDSLPKKTSCVNYAEREKNKYFELIFKEDRYEH